MQYIENATMLKTFIEEQIVGKDDIKVLMDNITNALGCVIAKLHSKRITHGDLTTSNILLKNPDDLINSKFEIDGRFFIYLN